MRRNEFNQYLSEKQFALLFNELGYDRGGNQLNASITVDELDFELEAVAQKRGFIVYSCEVEQIPQNSLCKKMDIKLRRYSNDYIVLFHEPDSEHQLWITPVKTVEKRDVVTIEYATIAQAEFLYNKLNDISFELEEEVTIVDVTARIHKAFEVNSGKITKDFYSGFKQQHKSFANFINGIAVEGDKQWYASVMLNRLMFCYFIQKKGFLNFDEHYLRNKLNWTQEQRGENQFFSSFYKGFLRALFHGGLNNPVHSNEFEKTYGRIPYLNGGMFDEHQLEKQYEDIDIDDKAFETLFEFFDKWRWHLDTRITATGRDINPDVLGYIFEQYINDRAQMGAYYTKEDITEYIGKNCIIPFLMDEVAKTSSGKHFAPNGSVWQLLKNSGRKYIYPAVQKGIDEPLPDYIEVGLDATQPNLLERRARWNEAAFEKHALPTEIWRETVERRKRCTELIHKIANAEITHINDFITYNLDIRTFVEDVLTTTTDHLLVLHFYKVLRRVTILDPTCGSGAFLFAALNILEPLYEICIARMEEFNAQNNGLFKDELAEITHKYRSNIQYFIYKSIILRNLYGVDIMAEATEIAKLRLFLKMVAVVDVNPRVDNLGLDPLPDIDFNIRCGNTLVGYATEKELEQDLTYGDMFANLEFKEMVEDGMEKVALTYQRFKDIQLNQHADMESFKQAKTELNNRLKELNETLNRRLHSTQSALKYEDWLASHQPFHWLAEYYQIIKGYGGFDVIIGNPPYVEHSNNSFKYKLDKLESKDCGNLYGNCIERSYILANESTRFSFIIPVAITCSKRMDFVIKDMKNNSMNLWFSNFDDRPGKLFEMIEHLRATIVISQLNKKEKCNVFTTKYIRWYTENRNNIFDNIVFVNSSYFASSYVLPKISLNTEFNILYKLSLLEKQISNYYTTQNISNKIYYRAAGGGYYLLIKDKKSITYINGILEDVKAEKSIIINSDYNSTIIGAVLSSTLFYWYYIANTDCRNLSKSFIDSFKLNNGLLIDEDLQKIGEKLFEDYESNKTTKNTNYKTTGNNVIYDEYYPKKSKPIIDEIDKVLAKHYGFTEEELDFIINYDIKYRMGKELEVEE